MMWQAVFSFSSCHILLLPGVYSVKQDRRNGARVAATDSLLLSRARAGDTASFDELFLRHYSRIYDVVFRLTGDAAEADDITQEAFIRLYRYPLSPGREHNVGGWLYRVAVNLGYNALRASRRRTTYEQASDAPTCAEPEAAVAQRDERRRVRETLAQLEPQQAQLLMLRYAGLSYKELAQALDVASTSIGTLLARAEHAFEARYRASAGSDVTGGQDAQE
jgi:RNA polymerase sigma-70 factor (ECF subfamily)